MLTVVAMSVTESRMRAIPKSPTWDERETRSRQHLGNVCFGQKYVLSLQVSMENFVVVQILDGKRHLHKPLDNLALFKMHPFLIFDSVE